jgi:hypothetical protein
MLLPGWLLFRMENIQDSIKKYRSLSEQILTLLPAKQWHLTICHTYFRTSNFQS